jgi:hypothetical protein
MTVEPNGNGDAFARRPLVAGNASSLLRQEAKRPRAKGLFEAGTFASGPPTARVQAFCGERSEPLALGLLASWRSSENERHAARPRPTRARPSDPIAVWLLGGAPI